LSSDRRLVVSAPAIKIVGKMLDKSTERVVVRRSFSLVEFSTAKASFVSKFLDGTFPDYTRVVPAPSGNGVVVDRAALLAALARTSAVAGDHRFTVAGLSWDAVDSSLRICLAGNDAADDFIAAESAGKGRVATRIRLLAEQLDAFDGERVCIDSRGATEPILITSPDDDAMTAVLMPCTWAEAARAA
jgi:DNA polymerase-3 subunit beta